MGRTEQIDWAKQHERKSNNALFARFIFLDRELNNDRYMNYSHSGICGMEQRDENRVERDWLEKEIQRRMVMPPVDPTLGNEVAAVLRGIATTLKSIERNTTPVDGPPVKEVLPDEPLTHHDMMEQLNRVIKLSGRGLESPDYMSERGRLNEAISRWYEAIKEKKS